MVRKVDYKILFVGIIMLVVFALMISNKGNERFTDDPGLIKNIEDRERRLAALPSGSSAYKTALEGQLRQFKQRRDDARAAAARTTPPAGGNTTPPGSGNTTPPAGGKLYRPPKPPGSPSCKPCKCDEKTEQTWWEWLSSFFNFDDDTDTSKKEKKETEKPKETYENYPTRSISYDDVESERFASF